MKKNAKLLAAMSVMALATAAQAQYVLGSFQGASDPNNAGWIDPKNGNAPITSDSFSSFVSGVVPGYAQSLDMSVFGYVGQFGYPTLELQLSPAQIAAFNANTQLTFTFSVESGGATSGYFQIYNLALNAPGPGYANFASGGTASGPGSWSSVVVSETGDTSWNQNGEPNFYMFPGQKAVVSETVTINYSSAKAAIIAGGESYLDIIFQGNQGGSGQATESLWNNVYLSVPEPTVMSLMGAGLALTGLLIRRRKA